MKRTVVIGGGVIGLACAYALSRRDHHVTVVDALPRVHHRITDVRVTPVASPTPNVLAPSSSTSSSPWTT